MSKGRKIGRVLFRVLGEVLKYAAVLTLCLVLGYNTYLINAEKTAGNAMPMPFGIGISEVVSGSMEPAISIGDLLVVKEQPTYRLEEIVVYQSGSMAIVHRIIEISGNTVITKGDANNAADDPVTVDNIRGKVICVIPKLGYAVSFLQTLPGMLLVVVMAILLLELSFWKKQRQDEQSLEQIKEEIRRLRQELEETNP